MLGSVRPAPVTSYRYKIALIHKLRTTKKNNQPRKNNIAEKAGQCEGQRNLYDIPLTYSPPDPTRPA